MEINELKKYGNEEKVRKMFVKTFSDSEGENEGALIGNLVSDFLNNTDESDLHIYTAIEEGNIVGAIVFSRIWFDTSDIKAFLLGPVAVHTDFQGRGIGQKLINWAHEDLKQKGVELVFTYGDINFYSKVGYSIIEESLVKAPLPLSYPQGWMAQSLSGDAVEPIAGESHCVEAIGKQEYW